MTLLNSHFAFGGGEDIFLGAVTIVVGLSPDDALMFSSKDAEFIGVEKKGYVISIAAF